ncbi:MAG: hypothetical protein HKM23_04590 [Nitrosopumilus sp.]|nr:hypothetical protein [Nitrosopumilus sp.]NNL59417.1 hypothetical protein [Nitrosopumilus sp.]
MNQKIIQRQPSEPKISLRDYDDYKKCLQCGQELIPFKLGVCVCGKQIGNTQYVQNPERFAKSNYANLGCKTKSEKPRMKKLMDN